MVTQNHLQNLRMESASFRAGEFIRKNLISIAQEVFGSLFEQLAVQHGMTERYKRSLKITSEGLQLQIELDYRSKDNNLPLGEWFETGTDVEAGGTHWIEPVNAEVLHWIDPITGEDRFSKGHEVKGITPTHIFETMTERGYPIFADELIKRTEEFMAQTELKWQK